MIAGIDGCSKGWFAVTREGANLLRTSVELEAFFDRCKIAAIDIPIGLVERGKRECDTQARKFLGRRWMCVFTAPVRAIVHFREHADANRTSRELGEGGVSKQAVAIYPKIAEVDAILARRRDLHNRVVEVHPEVSFASWNGSPMMASKHKRAGRDARRTLVVASFGEVLFTNAMTVARGAAKEDDVLDAFAALWTAERIARGEAQSLPDPRHRGGEGAAAPLSEGARIVY